MDIKGILDFSQDYFYSEETKQYISELKKEMIKYDVFDTLSRISALNLVPENQNKSVLFDALIEDILRDDLDTYTSNYKMSPSKFSKLIQKLGECDLSLSIDPNENSFVQNVMCNGNYVVFNGVDHTPVYNLQMMIYVLFVVQNNFPDDFLKKCGKLIMFTLNISNYIADSIGIKEIYDILPSEIEKVCIPNSEKVNKYADLLYFDTKWIEDIIGDDDLYNSLFAEFGTDFPDDMWNRSFYSSPFIRDEKKQTAILLNVSLLPNFTFYKVIELASQEGLNMELMNLYNEYIFKECRKSLNTLGHKKIKETLMGITLKNESYYKETILNVYNDQVMIVTFLCDDGQDYNQFTMHDYYPNSRHMDIFESRMIYLKESLIKAGIEEHSIYCVVLICAYGRGIDVSLKKDVFQYPILSLNPFELKCLSINESKCTDFLPRYIKVKSNVNIKMDYMLSELNSIELFTSNGYSFYFGDDINPYKTDIFIAPGDSIQYILKAMKRENRKLVDSYDFERYSEVVLLDQERKIYVEDDLQKYRRVAFYIQNNNLELWITSDVFHTEEEMNIYFSIADCISYWLGECRTIWSRYIGVNKLLRINIILCGELKEFYTEKKETDSLEKGLDVKMVDSEIILSWNPEAYRMMAEIDNGAERELITTIIKSIFKALDIPLFYEEELTDFFSNPLKKKFYVMDYSQKAYYKPVAYRENRCIHIEDEEILSDIIGKELLKSPKWDYGVIPDEDRTHIANEVVGKLYSMLQEEVALLNPFNLAEIIYDDLEIVLYNLMLVSKRYAYDTTCYPEKEEEYVREYNELNKTSVALKFFMEYIAACPPKGNRPVGIGKYEFILAICSMIVEWAYKNDLFYYHIFDTPIELLKSDRVGMKHKEFDELFRYGDQHRRQQLYYNSSELLRKAHQKKYVDHSEKIDEGFKDEYGYTFKEFYMVIMSMIDLGENLNSGNVKVLEKECLIAQLLEINPTLKKEVVENIFNQITLCERDDFLIPPKPYRKEDVYPWRFNRAYSFNRRPIIVRENEMIWGNRQLYNMAEYLLDLIHDGKLKTRKGLLKNIMGDITNERGNQFNQLVVHVLTDMCVFKVYPNVKSINRKKIADQNGNTLGDIDVLIIDGEKHRVYVAEVKDFNYSRNPYEMYLEYKKMFIDTDKEKCFATKHGRRVKWVENHFEDVVSYYGLETDVTWEVLSVFIVSKALLSNEVYHKGLNIISVPQLSVEMIRSIK